MQTLPSPLTCYIVAFNRAPTDPATAAIGLGTALVAFAIPAYGILFRTRTTGNLTDLEFRALFGVLGFIRNRLVGEKITAVRILSSNADLVFGLAPDSRHLHNNEKRRRLLAKFRRELNLTVEYIRPLDNQALLSPVDLPAMPRGARIALSPDPAPSRRSSGSSSDFGLDA